MKEIDWKLPKTKTSKKDESKSVPNPFAGLVKLKMPSYLERTELIKQLSFDVTPDGTVEVKDRASRAMEMAAKTLMIVKDHVVSLEVKHTKSGEKFSSLEDLEYYSDGVELINELSGIIIGGLRLGED